MTRPFAVLIFSLAALVLAKDRPRPGPATIEVPKSNATSADLKYGPCRQITFIYARGSIEFGNMGIVPGPGPQTCSVLKDYYGSDNVACQGVGGGQYGRNVLDNFQPQGATQAAINEGARLFRLANSKCPGTKITAGGWSQGATLIAASISNLPATIMEQTKGVVLYGYTHNKQNGAQIPNFPPEKTKIFCEPGDLVCNGTLVLTVSHFLYLNDVGAAKDFLVDRIDNYP